MEKTMVAPGGAEQLQGFAGLLGVMSILPTPGRQTLPAYNRGLRHLPIYPDTHTSDSSQSGRLLSSRFQADAKVAGAAWCKLEFRGSVLRLLLRLQRGKREGIT